MIPPARCPFLLRSTQPPFSRLFPPLHQSLTAESLRRASHLVCVLSPGPWVKYKRTRETLRTFIFHVRNCFSSPHQREWVEPQRTQEASQAARRTLGFWNRGDSISISFFSPLCPKSLFADFCKTFQNFSSMALISIRVLLKSCGLDKTVTCNLVVPPLRLPSKCLTQQPAARRCSCAAEWI